MSVRPSVADSGFGDLYARSNLKLDRIWSLAESVRPRTVDIGNAPALQCQVSTTEELLVGMSFSTAQLRSARTHPEQFEFDAT